MWSQPTTGTGGGAIAAFKAAGTKVPPVTGNDAELAAIQRIINGDQYNTISKPIKIVAEAAAQNAFSFLQGQTPKSEAHRVRHPLAAVRARGRHGKENAKEVHLRQRHHEGRRGLHGRVQAAGCDELGIS